MSTQEVRALVPHGGPDSGHTIRSEQTLSPLSSPSAFGFEGFKNPFVTGVPEAREEMTLSDSLFRTICEGETASDVDVWVEVNPPITDHDEWIEVDVATTTKITSAPLPPLAFPERLTEPSIEGSGVTFQLQH